MISADSKNPQPEAALAALLHGLRYRGLAVGPDDAVRITTVFRHATDWSHQRRLRVLKSLLARSDEERRVIDQLAPFLFVAAQRVAEDHAQRGTSLSQREEDAPVQPRFSSEVATPLGSHPRPLSSDAEEATDVRSIQSSWKAYLRRHVWVVSIVSAITVALVLGVFAWWWQLPPQQTQEPGGTTPPGNMEETGNPQVARKIPDTYEPPLPPRWPFWLLLGLSWIPVAVVVPRFVRFRRQKLNLDTLAASTGPRTYRFDLRPDEMSLPLDTNLMRDAAFHLHVASAEAPASWLDVSQTVESTVRNAGRLTLCFDTWREHRPVLFIEDCGPSMVRWPAMGRQIADALVRQGGTVTHYYMDRTPERLFTDRNSRAAVPLEQVLADLGEPTVVFLGDAVSIDPASAPPKHAWVGALSQAVWLHPQAADLWGPGAQWLAERIRVAPLSDEGLQRVGMVRNATDIAWPRRWRPPQVIARQREQHAKSRVAVLRAALGEETFWWLAAGAVLDHVGALTTRTWWHLRSEEFLPSLPSRESCNRVWELPDVLVGADGTVRLISDLRAALVEKLKKDYPGILSRVVAWAEARVQQDLGGLQPETLAAVEARALLGRVQLLDPKRHRAARRTLRQLAREGLGEWVSIDEAEEGVPRRLRVSLAPTKKPTPRAVAAAVAGALCLVPALMGIHNPEWFFSRARVVRITLNAPAMADASGMVALTWELQDKGEKPPTQWQVQRDGQDVTAVEAQQWQDTPPGPGPWRYQILALGSQKELYRSDGYEVVAHTSQPPPETIGMVLVPAGDFFMGCNEKVDTECDSDEKLGQTMNLAAFLIDKKEVTVVQFAKCVEAGKCLEKGLMMPYHYGKEQLEFAWACNWGKAGREQHPINCVDWNQANAFCESVGKRLPSEAEWEKAARGMDGRKYPWGNVEYGEAGKVANIADATAKKQNSALSWALEGYDDGFYVTAPVGSFPVGASPSYALDMIGNVWEWTADWSDEKNEARVVRGGSWYNQPRDARASHRLRNEPGNRNANVGFRCAQ